MYVNFKKSVMRLFWIFYSALCLALMPSISAAHGSWPPKHGGQRNYDTGEIAFELVTRGKQLTLYLEDHGQDLSTRQVTGTVHIKRGDKAWTGSLKPDQPNRLVVPLSDPLRKGDDVTANIQFNDGSIAQARFIYGVEVDLRSRLGTGTAPQLPEASKPR